MQVQPIVAKQLNGDSFWHLVLPPLGALAWSLCAKARCPYRQTPPTFIDHVRCRAPFCPQPMAGYSIDNPRFRPTGSAPSPVGRLPEKVWPQPNVATERPAQSFHVLLNGL